MNQILAKIARRCVFDRVDKHCWKGENGGSWLSRSSMHEFTSPLQIFIENSYFFLSFIIFQGSHVNINNMLCPAISDPFYGRLYRICAMLHQLICLPAVGKLIPVSAKYLKITPDEDIKETLVFITENNTEDSGNSESDKVTSCIKSFSDSENSQTVNDRNGTGNGVKTKIGDKNGIVYKERHCGDSVKQRLIRNGHLKEAWTARWEFYVILSIFLFFHCCVVSRISLF